MFGWLLRKALARAEIPESHIAYLLAFRAASPSAFRKFAGLGKLARHREVVPVEAQYAAILVGELAEDCGPCTQIAVDGARKAGVPDAQIEAVLRSDSGGMSDDVALGFRFAEAVVSRAPDTEEVRQEVRDRWGDKGVVDLTVALQVYRLFSMIKAGLGYATECRRVTLGSKPVEVARHAA